MRGIRSLLTAGFEQPMCAAAFEQLRQQALFAPTGDEARPEFTQDGEVETGISQLKAMRVLPIDTSAHGLGGLAVGDVLAKLQGRDERPTPRWQSQLTARRKAIGEVLITIVLSSSRSFRWGLPLGKAARAIRAVCSGTGSIRLGLNDMTTPLWR